MLFIWGVVSIFYRVFCLPLILYFLLSFIADVYSLLSCLCQYVTKRGRSRGTMGGNPICFVRGSFMFDWYFICFLFQTAYGFIFMSYSLIYVFICVLFEIKKLFCLRVLFPHIRLCICLVFLEIYRLIQLSCCLHLQLMDSS